MSHRFHHRLITSIIIQSIRFCVPWLRSSIKVRSHDIIIEFGIGRTHRSISLKALAESLGPSRCHALPFLHALTGSDTTSAFKGIGKKEGYDALKGYQDVEAVLADLYFSPFKSLKEDDDSFKKIQRLVILMYSRTSVLEDINELRMELYFQRTQNIENIPPTHNALFLHTLRCIYQLGVWSTCLNPFQDRPSPRAFGWKKADGSMLIYNPIWITQKEAIKECREFVKCSCSTEYCTRCKCKNAMLKCTLLCSCKCPDRVRFE